MVFANGDERTPSAPHTNTSGAPCPIVSYAIRVPSADVTYLVAITLLQRCRGCDLETVANRSIRHATSGLGGRRIWSFSCPGDEWEITFCDRSWRVGCDRDRWRRDRRGSGRRFALARRLDRAGA